MLATNRDVRCALICVGMPHATIPVELSDRFQSVDPQKTTLAKLSSESDIPQATLNNKKDARIHCHRCNGYTPQKEHPCVCPEDAEDDSNLGELILKEKTSSGASSGAEE